MTAIPTEFSEVLNESLVEDSQNVLSTGISVGIIGKAKEIG